MSDAEVIKSDVLLRSMDPSQGSWDGHYCQLFNENDFLAMVADAPVDAAIGTAIHLKNYLRAREPKLKAVLSRPDLDRERCALLLSDLVTGAGLFLCEQTSAGKAYGAAVFVLGFQDAIYALCVGDCAAWCLYGEADSESSEVIRISETTRYSGGSMLSVFRSGPARIDAVDKTSYLGGEPRSFSPRQVVVLPTADLRMIILVSDGAEEQLGADACTKLFEKATQPTELKVAFEKAIRDQPIVDDITVLAVRVTPLPDRRDEALKRHVDSQLEAQMAIQIGAIVADLEERTKTLVAESLHIENTKVRNDVSKAFADYNKALRADLMSQLNQAVRQQASLEEGGNRVLERRMNELEASIGIIQSKPKRSEQAELNFGALSKSIGSLESHLFQQQREIEALKAQIKDLSERQGKLLKTPESRANEHSAKGLENRRARAEQSEADAGSRQNQSPALIVPPPPGRIRAELKAVRLFFSKRPMYSIALALCFVLAGMIIALKYIKKSQDEDSSPYHAATPFPGPRSGPSSAPPRIPPANPNQESEIYGPVQPARNTPGGIR